MVALEGAEVVEVVEALVVDTDPEEVDEDTDPEEEVVVPDVVVEEAPDPTVKIPGSSDSLNWSQ